MRNLREDALRIWRAGLDAVRSDRLMREALNIEGNWLSIRDEEPIDLRAVERIVVVGAGKAGAGMAAELETILGDRLLAEKQVIGWVNGPADCVMSLKRIHFHPARPAGRNEPTEDGVVGAEKILSLVQSLGPRDVCFCLISGGGSALLPAPPGGITLADKLAITRFLSAAGADITELNTVRKQLSRIKGGRLAKACRAGRLISLIISDVPGDPLDLIASGPTVRDFSTPIDALTVLVRFDPHRSAIPEGVFKYLEQRSANDVERSPKVNSKSHQCEVTNLIIGNNAVAVDAAGIEAERLGYSAAMMSATKPEGFVEEIGRSMVEVVLTMRGRAGPDCLITGGEGKVRLVPESERGLGGRNQQLALAALIALNEGGPQDIALVSGGTDGEDGPTDAAGAFVDARIIAAAERLKLDPSDFLRRNDAYHFFKSTGGLLKTGPTHTNVCDLRVMTIARNNFE